jgi:hypothetical protein
MARTITININHKLKRGADMEGEAYFEYFESCDFSRENTNIDVSVFMFDLRMINMSSECEYDLY